MITAAERRLAEAEQFAKILPQLREELVGIAADAKAGIEHHSFGPYRHFRAKLAEHAALLAVTRERIRNRKRSDLEAALAEEEIRSVELSIRSTLGFLFSLSAIPLLPYGARETFLDELRALAAAHKRLTEPDLGVELSAGVLDELDMARMLLEEISERAPKLVEWAAEGAEAPAS
jgi:hypothetical protein